MPLQVRQLVKLPDLVASLLIGVLALSTLYNSSGEREPDLLGVLLVVAGAASLLVTRRYPIAVLGVSLAIALVIEALQYPADGNGLTSMWALYVVALHRPWRISLPIALVMSGLVVATIALTVGVSAAPLIGSAGTVIGAWALGAGARSRRSLLRAEERAALAEERASIAREMQDLVAHELAAMTVQVTAARRVAQRDPEAVEELLAGAEDTARTVVAEARRILALLSPGEAATGDAELDGTPDRAPLPGLDGLPELVRHHGEAGLFVELRTPTPAPELGSGPALLAFRTVEQALAHAARTGARTAEVAAEITPGHAADGSDDTLLVRVRHDGSAGPAPTLTREVGLARRAQLYGGTIDQTVNADGITVVLQLPAAGSRRTTP